MLDPEEMEAMEEASKTVKKSNFAKRAFHNTQDYVRGFLQEEEFIDVVKEI